MVKVNNMKVCYLVNDIAQLFKITLRANKQQVYRNTQAVSMYVIDFT